MLLKNKFFQKLFISALAACLLKILRYVPIIQSLIYFPCVTHIAAVKKFLFLWFSTSAPLIVAAAVTPIPSGNDGHLFQLFSVLKESVTVPELFVYTATYLTPILYILFEKFKNFEREDLADEFKNVFSGYWLIAVISLALIGFTAVAFGSLKINETAFHGTFLYYYLVNYSPAIYIFSLFCWYLSLLDESYIGDFEKESREGEKDVTVGLGNRVKGNR